MNPITSSAFSGMQAEQQRMQGAARNIANRATENLSPQSQQATATGATLEKDVVEQLQAKNLFLANFKVFKTTDAMTGSLLDQKV